MGVTVPPSRLRLQLRVLAMVMQFATINYNLNLYGQTTLYSLKFQLLLVGRSKLTLFGLPVWSLEVLLLESHSNQTRVKMLMPLLSLEFSVTMGFVLQFKNSFTMSLTKSYARQKDNALCKNEI